MKLRRSIIGRCLAALGASTAITVFAGASQQPASNPAAAATNAFALDLYRQLASDKDNDGKNLWFSPYSITSALAMTAEGARGSTLVQMAKTLWFGDASQAAQLLPIHEGMAALSREFDAGGAPGSAPTSAGLTPRNRDFEPPMPCQPVVANALWGDQQYPFDEKYVNTIRKYYAVSGLLPVDFQHDAESARSRINAWVEDQTRQKITDLLPKGSVDSATRLVLTNAVYFKGSWSTPFIAGATSSQPFHLGAAKTVSAPLMRGGAAAGYMENDQLQAISMPFRGGAAAQDVTMIVILPKKVDGLAEVEKSLTGENLGAWISALSSRPVQIFLPKFRMTNGFQLDKVLATMGMPDAFSPARADFGGISPVAIKDRLSISQVLHKAYLAIDENGAEAAAATAVDFVGGARAPKEPAVFRADHPFLVLLRHNPSGTILFLGRLMDPAVQ